jgi:oligosaccharyltransferase complex subunit alpha (ribophorin I)
MRSLAIATAILSFVSTTLCAAQENLTKPLTSRLVLPSTFTPPQVFKNINLVQIINLEKSYPKESINVVIENIAGEPQDEYFIPFTTQQMRTLGGLEVKDRKDPESGLFEVEPVEYDAERYLKCTGK